MEILTRVRDMQAWADRTRGASQRIGFVPTMGYLHAGHLSLVELARRQADQVVASIFVNPLQFGANEDLSRYPRDLERDTQLLRDGGTDLLFLPDAAEMYPAGYQTHVAVEELTRGLCGVSRPTHFQGVTTVVTKLFHIVKPHLAVFGAKDFQQLAAIRRMVIDLNMDIDIVAGAIVREADGLAMSSRNAYLSVEERQSALCLSQALEQAEQLVARGETNVSAILDTVCRVLAAQPRARIDYAELVDAGTLEDIEQLQGPSLLALAVLIGKTRLIDNVVLNPAVTCAVRTLPAATADPLRNEVQRS